jgi:hypothetical protein
MATSRKTSADVIRVLEDKVGVLKNEMGEIKKLILESNRLLALLTVEIQTANRRTPMASEISQTSGGAE